MGLSTRVVSSHMPYRQRVDLSPRPSECAMTFIQLERLSKHYQQGAKSVVVFDQLDLTAQAREIIVILGVSGTGKSTLLNILGGIDRVDQGRAVVAGRDLTTLSTRQLAAYRRDQVGFVFQFYNLLPSLTALENVLSALEAQGAVRQEGYERAGALLAAVGLAGQEHKF